MKPSEVPIDLLDAACDQMYGTPPDPGDDRAAVAFALAAVLPEHERQVRAAMGERLSATFQAMREDGESDMRTVIEHVRDAMRGAA